MLYIYCVRIRYPQAIPFFNVLFLKQIHLYNADQCQIFISTFFLLFLPFQKFPITHFIRLFLTLPISLIFLPSRSRHILGSKYA